MVKDLLKDLLEVVEAVEAKRFGRRKHLRTSQVNMKTMVVIITLITLEAITQGMKTKELFTVSFISFLTRLKMVVKMIEKKRDMNPIMHHHCPTYQKIVIGVDEENGRL